MVIRELLVVISGSVRVIINRLMVIRETLRIIIEVVRTITTSIMAIKIYVNHCNYGERLTLPIVFAGIKQVLHYN